jgi:hypothetical protein
MSQVAPSVQVPPQSALFEPLLSPVRATWPACLILLDLISNLLLGEDSRSCNFS